MKKSLIILLTVAFTFVACFSFNVFFSEKITVNSLYSLMGKCIVIDAGHGGADAGTVAQDGTLEKDINLSIALKLYDFLNVCGINCKLIRDDDSEFYKPGEERNRSDLYNRLDYVNSIDNSILVSIHQNHFPDTSQWGMQVWYTANEKSSKALADSILFFDKVYLQKNNKRINKESDDSYYILYNAQSPSVMVECGFMSNYEENNLLKDNLYQNKLACVIAYGINQYLEQR